MSSDYSDNFWYGYVDGDGRQKAEYQSSQGADNSTLYLGVPSGTKESHKDFWCQI
jgi:hypothetical protein